MCLFELWFSPGIVARSWEQSKCPSTGEWLKKMWCIYTHTHTHNRILLSFKMEWNWVICRDVDGHREHHTEWSQSEKGKQVPYVNTYMWNLEGWYRWSYLQSRKRGTDIENKHMDIKGERREVNWEIESEIHTVLSIK